MAQKAVMDKADSMHEQLDNMNRDVEILRKNQKETQETKNHLQQKWRLPLTGLFVDFTMTLEQVWILSREMEDINNKRDTDTWTSSKLKNAFQNDTI